MRGDTSGELRPSRRRREPIRGIKRQMFEHLTRAHDIPAVTWVEEADFGDVDLKQLLPRVLKAVAAALREFPELNARVDGNDLVLLDRYDIGIAIQTEQGLVVPVVRDCDARSVEELDVEVRAARRRRAGRQARCPRSCAAARSPSRAQAVRRACS